jgi:lipopolysaccharide/colanic/teichoic acid biosynthesis glycosyltransferase
MNGKPFFFQERTGLQNTIFRIVKFRTMKNGDVTSYGSFLRKFSLDELPQLFNVLIGQMSLIGPRPLLPEYLPLYNDFQKRRLLIKPGITGWAQVNGRNEISWEEKFKLDVWYIENISLSLDLKIALKTILQIKNKNQDSAERFDLLMF